MAVPSNLPFNSGKTRPTALAAPVDVGIIELDAVLALLRSECIESRIFWSDVNECTVVIKPEFIPNLSFITLAIGARQFVVQEALEIISCFSFKALSFTPYTTVMSASLDGAEIITFLTPLFRCPLAFSLLVNNPVHSKTMSTLYWLQEISSGNLLEKKVMGVLLIDIVFPLTSTLSPIFPWIESYLNKWAFWSMFPMSLIATTRIFLSSFSREALNTNLPILPNPLIPILIIIIS